LHIILNSTISILLIEPRRPVIFVHLSSGGTRKPQGEDDGTPKTLKVYILAPKIEDFLIKPFKLRTI
jgi:hypothetical protein